MNKKMKAIFTASVLLNIFLIGLTIGGVSRELNHEARIKHKIDRELTEFTEILPEQERAEFRDRFKQLAENNEQIRQQTRVIRKEIAAIFRAEPFDEELFYLKTQEMHDLRGAQMLESSQIIGQMAGYLTLEQRKLLNKKLSMGKRRMIKQIDREQRP